MIVTTEIQIRNQNGDRQSRSEAAAIIEKYRGAIEFEMKYDITWGTWSSVPRHPVDTSSPLIPRADLPALIAALESTLKPASPKEVAGAAGLIATAWPFAWQRLDEQTAEAFAAQLNEELPRYPADVLRKAVVSLRRAQKFAPAIA